MTELIVVLAAAVIVFVVVSVVGRYLRLLRLSARAEEAWSDIRLLLKRRYELIPMMADTIQKYATTEREVYQRLIVAKERTMRVAGAQAVSDAEEGLRVALRDLLAIVEKYPQLKAHEGLRYLYGELADIEVRLRRATKMYNRSVAAFNRSRRWPHARLVARLAGLHKEHEPFVFDASKPTVTDRA